MLLMQGGVTVEIWKDDFEQLLFLQDRPVGLKAIIAIHSTRRGAALGGCRMRDYASEEEAIRDALRLAKGMTYKSAISGLPYGGGKAVILGYPEKGKHELYFRSLGRFIQGLQGLYITGMDLGTTAEDMDCIGLETDYVTDTSGSLGASGDFTARMTAYGVYLGIKASLKRAYGTETIKNKIIAVQGLGKVGVQLCRYLSLSGARLIVSDLNGRRMNQAVHEFGASTLKPEEIVTAACDIFSPCAIGGIINDDTVERLSCNIVAGAANNQLAKKEHGETLHRQGILYAPDYVINAGGIIVTFAELNGKDHLFAKKQVENIYDTLTKVYDFSEASQAPPSIAADELAEQMLVR
jgi:leucine dehydrogenase